MWVVNLDLLRDVLLMGGTLGALVLVLAALRRGNALLFWCVVGAVSLHLSMAGILLAAGRFSKPAVDNEPPTPLTVSIQPSPVVIPTPTVTPPPTPPRQLESALNQGRHNGNRHATHMPRGNNPQGTHPGAPGPGSTNTTPSIPICRYPPLSVPSPDDHLSQIAETPGGIRTGDVPGIGTQGGGGGDGAGTNTGEPGAEGIPIGDPAGKINGRVYFVRLKHDVGAWYAYDEGIHRLLGFMNQYFRCERESVPMTATQMRDYYRRYHRQPTFLYVYCDEAFALSHAEVSALHDYLGRGGFLFLDSRPDPAIRAVVMRELDKVQPGERLLPIARAHPINHFLFRLAQPGVGENLLDQRNYGLTRAERLQVFYTPGNFAHLYAANPPDALAYITAQYQMGANIVLYAIRNGDAAGLETRPAASATITNQSLTGLFPTASPTPAPSTPPTQIHHGPAHTPFSDPTHGEEPGEIEIGH